MKQYIPLSLRDNGLLALQDRSPAFLSAAFLLIVAMLFGGGGSRFALSEMLVQLSAIPALVIGLGKMREAEEWPAFRPLILLCGAAILLVIVQLIPLPPAIWQALPGRELLAEAAGLVGDDSAWRPWSINPELTLQSGLSLIIPIAMISAVLHFRSGEVRLLLMIALVMVMVNFGTAMLQSLSGGNSFYPYETTHKGLPIGLFANRNHMAQLLLMAIFMSAGLFLSRGNNRKSPGQSMLLAAFMVVLAFGIVATNSRTVTALLIPASIFLAYRFVPERFRKQGLWIIGAGVLAAAGIFALLVSTGRFQVFNILLDRFAQDEDHRFEFWPDAWNTMLAYFPFGSGAGTFDTVFRAHEKLSTVGTHYVNNAHNDYLEVGIETGIFGLAIIAGLVVWTVNRARGLLVGDAGGRRDTLAYYAVAALGCVALHSLIDYPLRSLSLMTFASLLFAVIAASASKPVTKIENSPTGYTARRGT